LRGGDDKWVRQLRSRSQSHHGASSSPGASSSAPISPSSWVGGSSSTCSRRRRTTHLPCCTCWSSTPPWGSASLSSARSLQGRNRGECLGQDGCPCAPLSCPPITSRQKHGNGHQDETLLVGRSCSILPHIHAPAQSQPQSRKGP